MSPPGGSARLSPVDRRAALIGRLCAAACLSCVFIAAGLLLLAAGDVVCTGEETLARLR